MKKQSGFTFVEFMVAMAVTTVVMGAAMLTFRDSSRTNQRVTLGSDMSDNLRAGLNLIQQDLIQAGTGIPTGGIAVPTQPPSGACTSGVSAVNRPTLTGSLTFPVCNVVMAAVEPGQGLGPFITSPDATSTVNSDLITVLYADNTLALDARQITGPASAGPPATPACNGSITSSGDAATFDANCIPNGGFSSSGTQVNPGDLIMFSNVNGSAVQTVSSVSGLILRFAAGDAFNLNGTGAPSGTLIQLQNYTTDSNGNKVYNVGTYPPTTATRIWMISYYLDNLTDASHVRLVRRVNFNPGQPVGETLENLQFTFNFVNGTVLSTNQATVPSGFSENQIRAVNVYLGARSADPVLKGGKSAYLRSSLQTLVCLRSMAYVNKYL
jgi:prepilin-type N-terminal cleavage/methylation domain-containing protein